MIKRLVTVFLLAGCLQLAACSDTASPSDNEGNDTEEPGGDGQEEGNNDGWDSGKEKILWFDAEANFRRFENQATINKYIQMAREAGFNKIAVDVKGVQGEALYESDILPKQTYSGGYTINRTWDYLGYFLEAAKQHDMKVTVSATIFAGGIPSTRRGIVYNDSRWDGKTCMQYNTDGTITDIRDDRSKVAAFLNPADEEVRDFTLGFIEELVTKYDFDALALDYCRFPDGASDFSKTSREAFEKYIGQAVENFPQDIFTYDGSSRVPGKWYKEWWEFRSMLISDFIGEVKTRIKAIKPDMQLEYWAAAWWQVICINGQNWASTSYDPSQAYPGWASENYYKTGFAGHLDTFQLGAYRETVYGADNPESIEYDINRAKNIIGDACSIYGSYFALNAIAGLDITEATYICLKRTDGLMVFDISNLIDYNLWEDVRKGIAKAEAEMKEESGNTK